MLVIFLLLVIAILCYYIYNLHIREEIKREEYTRKLSAYQLDIRHMRKEIEELVIRGGNIERNAKNLGELCEILERLSKLKSRNPKADDPVLLELLERLNNCKDRLC